MKVYVYPADKYGCGHYRLIWPARALKRDGHNVTVIPPDQRASNLRGFTNKNNELIDVQIPPDTDVMVLQRITHRHLVRAIEIIRDRGVAVVIDMDDDLAAIDPGNPAFTAMHPQHGLHGDHSWHNAQRACEVATHVTVSTDELLRRYAPHGRGTVLRNCVPRWYLDVPRHDSSLIGWGGSVSSHPNDLPVLGSAIRRLIDGGERFRVVGPEVGVGRVLGIDEVDATGEVDLITEWPTVLARLGVGIAPLADTRFNRSKSWLKPLEYAALGVPCVVSPRTEYRRIHELGIGLLAERPKDWVKQLRRLTTDAALRAELSERGREVARTLTIEDNAWRWANAWLAAYDTERGDAVLPV